jgi:predicted anti-sigma-YlaC factor YlaD
MTVRCEELSNDLLMDVAVRAAEPDAIDRVTEHLSTCLVCGERYLEVKQIHETTRIALRAQPAASLDARVVEVTGKVMALKRRTSMRKTVLWILAALAAAGGAILAWMLFKGA